VLKGSVVEPVVSLPAHDRESSDDSVVYEESHPHLSKLGMSEADRHFVDVGPAWKAKLPPFRVLVHSPTKCSSTLSGSYTIYSVTSLFHSPPPETLDSSHGPNDPPSPTRLTVHRRFSHFVILHTALTRRLPGIALPPLPEKQYAGRFSSEFVEARRSDLERYIGRVVRHPVARYAEIVTFFLGCDNDIVSFTRFYILPCQPHQLVCRRNGNA
jgi:sorting nexin-9/18/33